MGHATRFTMAMAGLLCAGAMDSHAPGAAPACPADLDSSGAVTGIDIAVLLGQWGLCPPPSPPGRGVGGEGSPGCAADLDSSGTVNGIDLAMLLGAWGPCPKPPIPTITYTPVMFQGTPAPGISFPGAFIDVILTPQIDAQGNILFKSFIGAPGLGEVGNQAIFHGQPGNINKLIWETDPAPGFPPGVIIKNLFGSNERLCEAGIVTFGAQLQGPSIVPGVNDMAIFCGDPRIAPGQPGSIHKIFQTGQQAPGLEPGVLMKDDLGGAFFGVEQSDNGTVLLFSHLVGTGVTYGLNDHAWWTGDPDSPQGVQLVWRRGMPAPGTPPGVTFTWADFFSINDAGQIAFRGGLTGPGIIDGVSDRGQWYGGPGSLQVVAWTGVPAPGLPAGSTFAVAFGGVTSINAAGEMQTLGNVQGPGITAVNDEILCAGSPGQLQLAAREGDAVPEAGDDVSIDLFGTPFLNNRHELFFAAKLRGRSIAGQSVFAAFLGPYHKPVVTLLNGKPAPYMSTGIILSGVQFTSGLAAMNDVGDVVTVTKIAGTGVTQESDVVLWLYHAVLHEWWPLIRGGDQIDGRTVSIPEPADLLSSYWQKTGGADGWGLSFNDARQLVLKLKFADSSQGIFVISITNDSLPWR